MNMPNTDYELPCGHEVEIDTSRFPQGERLVECENPTCKKYWIVTAHEIHFTEYTAKLPPFKFRQEGQTTS